MKATLRNGKGSARHNDRSYEGATTKEKEEVIFSQMAVKNAEDFYDNELKAFNTLYGKWLEEQNEKYDKKRQYKYKKNMEDILGKPNKGKTKGRYEPTETILQIGKYGDDINLDVFKACINDFIRKTCKNYGKNVIILDFAIHKEEGVYHAHIRRTYYITDKNGHKKPAKKEALRQLGFYVPKEENNAKNNETVLYTKEERQLWYDILKEHNFIIDEKAKIYDEVVDSETYKKTKKNQEKTIENNNEIIASQEETIRKNKEAIARTQSQKQALDETWLGVGSINDPVKGNGQSLEDLISLSR